MKWYCPFCGNVLEEKGLGILICGKEKKTFFPSESADGTIGKLNWSIKETKNEDTILHGE